ncbi:EamA domain-containing membrane protein RarD [Novosphingobium sp. CF614]|uniref:DMT family transporter n=1 Tax=Novosphingobium sp. CF614 TaxID=1884364 RepID=UPI0008EE0C67|nr:DMT family transporter [Novosphingobium sp. CF614]SFG05660.1 EamA domain-containing membrane protein RarD [Novosphingobium sp. CF614]
MKSHRPLLAIALRAGAMVLLSTMLMLVKYAGQLGVSVPEILFWRMLITLPVLLIRLGTRGQLGRLATRRIGTHARRAALGMVALFCNITAALLLPLAEATTFSFTTPLFVVLITGLFLQEKVGPWRWAAVVLGFVGVLIIAQPGAAPVSMLGVAAGLGAGILVALVSFQVSDLARTEDATTCVFWFAFFGALFASVLMPAYHGNHSLAAWGVILAIGLTGTLAQLLLTAALRYGQVATVVVMDYTSLIWATLYGWLIWGHFPSHATWLGAPAIVAAGLVITWREHVRSRHVSPTSALSEAGPDDQRET